MYSAILALALSGSSLPGCDLSVVTQRYEAWRGGQAFGRLRTIGMQGTMEPGGLRGTKSLSSDIDGRSRLDLDLGSLTQHQAATPNGAWEITPSGQVQSMALTDALSLTREQKLLFSGGLSGAHGAAKLAGCSIQGHSIEADISVSFGDDDTYDAFIDTATGKLIRIRIVEERQPREETFGDWRIVDGVRMPFLRRTNGATPSDAETLWVSSLNTNVPIAPAHFARPQPRRIVGFRNGAASTGWIGFTYFAGNRIFFPALINDHPVMVMLDSGATVSAADTAFARQIGLTSAGAISAPGTGGVATAGLTSGVDVKIGNLTLSKLTVATIDLAPIAKRIGHPMPFVLGDEIFNEAIVDIDTAHHRLAFHDPATFTAPPGAVEVPLHHLLANRSVPVSVEGSQPLDFEFDLGNGSPLQVYPALYGKRDLLSAKRTSQILAGGVGGDHPETVASLDRIDFAGTVFRNVPATFTRDAASAANSNRVVGNIGLPILARFRLLIDYSHDRLFVVPEQASLRAPFARDRLGLSLTRRSDAVLVRFVSPNGPAEASGLKMNDRVSAIAGKAASEWSDAELAALRFLEGGEAVVFTMADGSTRSVQPAAFY